MKRSVVLVLVLGAVMGCGEGGDAVSGGRLEDPSQCVPLEEREACLIHDERSSLGLKDGEDIERVCKSTCRLVKKIHVSKEIAELSVLRFLSFEEPVSLTVFDAPKLESLEGLEAATKMRYIAIESAPLLTTLEPLRNVSSMQSLELASNNGLTSLRGLEGLQEVGLDQANGLTLRGNQNLETLDGLDNLRAVLTLDVTRNPKLRTARALKNLELATGAYYFEGNDVLTELPRPQRLEVRDTVVIRDNPRLPQCEVEALLERAVGEDGEEVKVMHGVNGGGGPEACP